MKIKKKIVVTGGTGIFGKVFKSMDYKKKFLFPKKSELNITSVKSIINYLKKKKTKNSYPFSRII